MRDLVLVADGKRIAGVHGQDLVAAFHQERYAGLMLRYAQVPVLVVDELWLPRQAIDLLNHFKVVALSITASKSNLGKRCSETRLAKVVHSTCSAIINSRRLGISDS